MFGSVRSSINAYVYLIHIWWLLSWWVSQNFSLSGGRKAVSIWLVDTKLLLSDWLNGCSVIFCYLMSATKLPIRWKQLLCQPITSFSWKIFLTPPRQTKVKAHFQFNNHFMCQHLSKDFAIHPPKILSTMMCNTI